MDYKESITVVNPQEQFKEVKLIEPSEHHFLLLAAEVDSNVFPFPIRSSKQKKSLLHCAKELCQEMEQFNEIIDATVFKARLTPPGRGQYIKEHEDEIHIANYDVVVLIEQKSPLRNDSLNEKIKSLKTQMQQVSKHVYFQEATNLKRIGPVDHTRQGVFLFNFFHGALLKQTIGIWHFTAGWFMQETNLDNSTVLLPNDPETSDYTIINHCRWDSMKDILPALIFKRTFKSYVLDNFYANKVGAMPILYELA
ncbi:MAG: hypothetical protein RIC35_11090 [Marinoscillum sp.]